MPPRPALRPVLRNPAPFPADTNWLGILTLTIREIRKFTQIWGQTLIAPTVTSLLFMAVFSLVHTRESDDLAVPYHQFLIPGLVIMSVLQNAFVSNASSLVISKIQGNIVDILTPPLSSREIATSYGIAGLVRGVMVGAMISLLMWSLFPAIPRHPLVALCFLLLAATLTSLAGIIVGIWAAKFSQLAAMTNFVVVPLAFLSGSFYPVARLPESVQALIHYNPFFAVIDGYRYGITGHAEGNPVFEGLFVLALVIVLWSVSCRLLHSGYRLRE